MGSTKVSMQQIADSLGLSKYAVSKALAGKEGVSPATRERIIQAATQLGYYKQQKRGRSAGDKPAASVAERSPIEWKDDRRTVAVLMPNIRLQTMESGFWSLIVQGIMQELDRQELALLIVNESTVEPFARVLKPEQLLGVIGVGQISTQQLLEVQRLGLPFVLTDHEDPLVPSDCVFASNLDSMALITGHLLALGHRSIWFLGDPAYSRSFSDRWIGYRKSMEELGLTVDPEQVRLPLSGNDRERNRRLLLERLQQLAASGGSNRPTALAAANDEIALAAMEVLAERGLRIPQDVAVTGFDNIAESGRTAVQLTTVHVRKEQLGERAVLALLDRIRAPQRPFEKISLSCEMILRASSGAAVDVRME